eukprot:jgi/Mesen1/7451/ME000389S06791
MAMVDLGPAVSCYTAFSVAGAAWRLLEAVMTVAATDTPSSIDTDVGYAVSFYGMELTKDNLQVLHEMMQSKLTVAFLVNLGLLLLSLLTKAVFFGNLTLQEAQKLAERLINYVLFKVLFLIAAVEVQAAGGHFWLSWFALLGFFKIFAGLGRDRFERLCASPTASKAAHARTLSLLCIVLFADMYCMRACMRLLSGAGVSSILLLNFEAVIIALDASQTVVRYSLHLLETYAESCCDATSHCAATNAAWAEWRGHALFYVNLVCDLASLLLTLAHYVHVWCLHGLLFQLVDALLFLNIRALLAAIKRRVQVAARYLRAIRNLRSTFPDATADELEAFNDDCAICKEPMGAAKKLPCSHLFHLSCLRSWLEQGAPATYCCPTCRSTLVGPSLLSSPNSSGEGGPDPAAVAAARAADVRQADGDTAVGLQRSPSGFGGQAGAAAASADVEPEGSFRWDSSAAIRWANRSTTRLGADGAGSGGSDAWWWPFGPPDGISTGGQVAGGEGGAHRQGMAAGGLRFRGARARPQFARPSALSLGSLQSLVQDDESSALERMAAQVEEVLPHLPRHIVLEDLRRTNSVAVTVSRLLEE